MEPSSSETASMAVYTGFYFRLFLSVVAAHVIVVYGDPEPTFSILLSKSYYIAMIASIIIAFLLISYVHLINQKLNERIKWEDNTLQRAGCQVGLSLVIPGIFAFFMAALYFRLNGIDILKTLYLRIDFPFIMVLLFSLNLYYLVIYLIIRLREVESKKMAELDQAILEDEPVIPYIKKERENSRGEQEPKETYLVHTPLKTIPVSKDQISFFFRKNGHNFLHTYSNDVYAIPDSLREIEELFGGDYFFRINRQMIVAFKACIAYRPGRNKTIEVTLYPPFSIKHRDEETQEGGSTYVSVSEDRVQAFREWMNR